ncbi:TIGR01212 family radical SAM protein [Chakrabartyella piscis]|uniref:TIGR01212 family radical SAM protein n=1 Tax=Chakrabartyella piscis TaxID=2918914 RepID=UPI0029584848|nr:TIGR01212 family radical SAM protein [Chakrabartyella piscis]
MGQYPYLNLNEYYRGLFGKKAAKISLDGGFSCPNRDGTLSFGGCIFCSEEGSGDFAQDVTLSITDQIAEGKIQSQQKWKDTVYIAYFQAYTNTYAPVCQLRAKYEEAINQEDVVGISIATRPDCFSPEIYDLLEELNETSTLWVELGLQTAKEETALCINRQYKNEVFETAFWELHKRNIPVVVHVILGLPNETLEDMLQTIDYLNQLPIQGVKLHLMHVIRNTALARLYEAGDYRPLEMEEYLHILSSCVARLRPDIVIHRLTGDGKKEDLLAPLWSLRKGDLLNSFHRKLKQEGIYQGQTYTPVSK